MAGLKAIVLMAGLMIALFATVVLRYTLWRGANPLVAAVTTHACGGRFVDALPGASAFVYAAFAAGVPVDGGSGSPREHALAVGAHSRDSAVDQPAWWIRHFSGVPGNAGARVARLNWRSVQPRWPQIRRYSALLLGCSLASLANPYGIQLHVHIVEYLRADWIKSIVQEFQAPTFRSEGQLQFEVLLLAGLITSGFLLRRRMFAEALWMVFLAHSSLISVRHAPLYATVAAPLIACEISDWWRAGVAAMKKSSALRILYQLGADLAPGFRRTSIWPAVLILSLAALDAPLKWPRDFPSEMFPTAMVHQHAGLIASGRLLTADQWGDYIIYSFYPRQKVYVDGRSDFYGEKLGREYLHLLQGAYDWRAIMDRNGFNVALLPVDWPLASMLKLDPSWQVVQDDTRAILFQRVSTANPEKLGSSAPQTGIARTKENLVFGLMKTSQLAEVIRQGERPA